MSEILEIAQVRIRLGSELEFEAALEETLPLLVRARGNRGVSVRRSIEHPERYVFLVRWDSVDDHLIGFMQSEDFKTFIGSVGGYFEGEPTIEHTTLAVG